VCLTSPSSEAQNYFIGCIFFLAGFSCAVWCVKIGQSDSALKGNDLFTVSMTTSHVRSLAPSLTFAAIACYYPSMSDLKAAQYASGESTCIWVLFKCINLEIETMV